MVAHKYVIKHLPLRMVGLFVTNLSSNFILEDTLRDMLKIISYCNGKTYDIPGFKETIEAMYPWILALNKHFMEFRYTIRLKNGYKVSRDWKNNEPYENHDRLQREHIYGRRIAALSVITCVMLSMNTFYCIENILTWNFLMVNLYY